ncbi:MAG: hypothetical protein AB1757_13700 [Acidobacteriota bacterium]
MMNKKYDFGLSAQSRFNLRGVIHGLHHQRLLWRRLRNLQIAAGLLLFFAISGFSQTVTPTSTPTPAPASTTTQIDSLPAAEFSRLIRECSEPGGYFRSDNFTSNEMSYLYVTDKLRQLGASGGAYIGVGPEQNFTYIAKIRPRIAFIVDIRRQAIIQHLMYKAVFHLANNRLEFLSRLLSRPLPKEKIPAADAPITEILNFISRLAADDKTYDANFALIRKTIEADFQFPLTPDDQRSLAYVYKSFRDEGLSISYRMDSSWGMNFPTLREILEATDMHGRQGNFLATVDDFEFVRDLHRKNLIIPVVGDFGGKKAIAAVGDYLRKNNFTVTAFYTSNVEQYLFDGTAFTAFVGNVRKLPLSEKSLFIRAVFLMLYQHPASAVGNGLTVTLLESMPVFIKDFDAGRYPTYEDLIITNYIAPDKVEKK